MLLQLGIKSSWFYVTPSTGVEIHLGTRGGDLRHFLLESSLPDIGETVAAEVLLKSLETYRRAGMHLLYSFLLTSVFFLHNNSYRPSS